MDRKDKDLNVRDCFFEVGPFEMAQYNVREFVINLCEASLFKSLYEDPICKQMALSHLLRDPKLKLKPPN